MSRRGAERWMFLLAQQPGSLRAAGLLLSNAPSSFQCTQRRWIYFRYFFCRNVLQPARALCKKSICRQTGCKPFLQQDLANKHAAMPSDRSRPRDFREKRKSKGLFRNTQAIGVPNPVISNTAKVNRCRRPMDFDAVSTATRLICPHAVTRGTQLRVRGARLLRRVSYTLPTPLPAKKLPTDNFAAPQRGQP